LQVFGCGRDAAALQSLREELAAGHGSRWQHQIREVDVTDDAAVSAWSREVLDDIQAPDLLISNAAVINPNGRLWELSAAEFDRVMMINVSGTANVLRHFVPTMVARRAGVIVNLSSGWGRSVSAEVAPYCASKWAIEGLTLALAEELPEGMAAVPLNPGIINTEMLQRCFREGAAAYPSPDQWARRAVPFLLGLNANDNGRQLTVPEQG
jgi:NAD(P)-dependent dehydrogenase (short-subunit alcohol dehydrogenase family)